MKVSCGALIAFGALAAIVSFWKANKAPNPDVRPPFRDGSRTAGCHSSVLRVLDEHVGGFRFAQEDYASLSVLEVSSDATSFVSETIVQRQVILKASGKRILGISIYVAKTSEEMREWFHQRTQYWDRYRERAAANISFDSLQFGPNSLVVSTPSEIRLYFRRGNITCLAYSGALELKNLTNLAAAMDREILKQRIPKDEFQKHRPRVSIALVPAKTVASDPNGVEVQCEMSDPFGLDLICVLDAPDIDIPPGVHPPERIYCNVPGNHRVRARVINSSLLYNEASHGLLVLGENAKPEEAANSRVPPANSSLQAFSYGSDESAMPLDLLDPDPPVKLLVEAGRESIEFDTWNRSIESLGGLHFVPSDYSVLNGYEIVADSVSLPGIAGSPVHTVERRVSLVNRDGLAMDIKVSVHSSSQVAHEMLFLVLLNSTVDITSRKPPTTHCGDLSFKNEDFQIHFIRNNVCVKVRFRRFGDEHLLMELASQIDARIKKESIHKDEIARILPVLDFSVESSRIKYGNSERLQLSIHARDPRGQNVVYRSRTDNGLMLTHEQRYIEATGDSFGDLRVLAIAINDSLLYSAKRETVSVARF